MSELGPDARALVEAGRGAFRPDASDRARIREALLAKIQGAPPAEPNPSAMPAAPGLGVPALGAIAVGVILAGGVAFFALRPGEPKGAEAPAAVVQKPAPPPVVASPPPQVVESPAPTSPPTASPPSVAEVSSARRPSDRLAEEVRILSLAEKEFHAGGFASALRLLEDHQRRFPRGTLTQERTAARARALCALGRTTEAEGELRRLAPGSLHEGRAREYCARKKK